MSLRLDIVPRIMRPRAEGGCDYGKPRLVVARVLASSAGPWAAELRWRPGHRAWQGRGQPWETEPGVLNVVLASQPAWMFNGTDIAEGGRLSRKLLASADIQRALVEHFGAEVAAALSTLNPTKNSLLVTPE